MESDDICLNIDNSGAEWKSKSKNRKTERKSAVQGVKHISNRQHVNDSVHASEVKKSQFSSEPVQRKRKLTTETACHHEKNTPVPVKKPKFSSLFTNNPEIPQMECVELRTLSEVVFSGSSFTCLKIHPFMVSNLEKMGITEMTSVQQTAIPVVLQGHDVLICSQTGSGKTLSYAIPIVERLQSQMPKIQRSDGPYCIVVVPTRELVLQTYETFRKLVQPFLHVVPGCIMGGEKKKSEKARLRRGINVLVTTPGRLMDHVNNTKSLKLLRVKYLVIDEADRLLELGFEKSISQIVSSLDESCPHHRRQTILLSATLTSGVERLAGMTLENPIRLDATRQVNDKSTATTSTNSSDEFAMPDSLTHHFVIVPSKLRLVSLAAFLLSKCKRGGSESKLMIFLATQDSVEFHHRLLSDCLCAGDDTDIPPLSDIELYQLHGDMPQKERTDIFQKFHAAKSGVLLTTDVAARGLDVPHVQWIIQYNSPGRPVDYVHRVGRTARIGGCGSALLFVTPAEVDYIRLLRDHKIRIMEIDMETILKSLMSCGLVHKGVRAHTVQDSAAFLQVRFEQTVSSSKQLHTLARKAFQSYVRAYATYPGELKRIFHVRNLHLGHVAKSFALTDAPSKISELAGQLAVKSSPRRRTVVKLNTSGSKSTTRPTAPKVVAFDPMSEFASGL